MTKRRSDAEARLSKPDTDRGRLQRAILKILREHEQQPDGLPTSCRFIFYELVQRGVINKKAKEGAAAPIRTSPRRSSTCASTMSFPGRTLSTRPEIYRSGPTPTPSPST